jgi:hypothetical protein
MTKEISSVYDIQNREVVQGIIKDNSAKPAANMIKLITAKMLENYF